MTYNLLLQIIKILNLTFIWDANKFYFIVIRFYSNKIISCQILNAVLSSWFYDHTATENRKLENT